MKPKLIRITTVPVSLKVLLRQQLQFMSDYFEVLAVSSPGKELEEVGRSEGVRTVPVVMTRSITPLKDLKALWRLYRLFRKEKPDIVHTHTPKAGLLGMIAARMAGVPIRLHTVAGLPLMENKGFRRKILEYAERVTYLCATKIYPNSRSLAGFLLQHRFCRPGKIQVIGNGSSNGIDTDFFRLNDEVVVTASQLRKNLSLGTGDFVFVFIGRLVRDKGMEELVDAFMALKKKYTDVKLLLVGPFEPDLDPLPDHTATTIASDKDIIHVDFQQDIRPFLAISHILVFPSYREGFPNVPMQAGCFHLPAIVTDINGCNEIIEQGRNGLVVPVKNREALRETMEILMVNQVLHAQLKMQARQMIVERYEQKHFWSLLLHEYTDQVSKYASVPPLWQAVH
jgi:glycosyltransferase involved in cell wall biosynthesis